MSQRELFDGQAEGLRRQEEALAAVESNADPQWMEAALSAVRILARRMPILTTDDLWCLVDPPAEPRAAGAVMRKAAKQGWIKATDRTVKSKRATCHARPVRVWESLIYEEARRQ